MTELDKKNTATGSTCGCKGKTAFLLLLVGLIFGFIIGFAVHDNVVRKYIKVMNTFTKSQQIPAIEKGNVKRTVSVDDLSEQDELKEDDENNRKEEEETPKTDTASPAL